MAGSSAYRCACADCSPHSFYHGPEGKPPHGWDRFIRYYMPGKDFQCLWICLTCHVLVYDEGQPYSYLAMHKCPQHESIPEKP